MNQFLDEVEILIDEYWNNTGKEIAESEIENILIKINLLLD